MAQSGYTPISLYHSTTASAAPTSGNLVNGELALNITDKKLYAKDNGGNVFVLANAQYGAPVGTRVVVIADATSVTIDADTTDIATQANTQAAGTLTINAPTGTPANGQKIIFRLRSTNVQTFSWDAAFAGSTDLNLPATSSGSSKYDYMGFMYNSTATKWQLIAKVFGF